MSMSKQNERKRAAIIGAGVCGLTTTKCCVDEGIDVIVYERTGHTGGLWRFRAAEKGEDGTASVMNTTIINSSKETSAFSDFPPPAEFCNYMHNSQMMEYLDDYGKKFNFAEYVRLHHDVISVTPSKEQNSDTTRWQVHAKDVKTGLEQIELFDAVYVCTGHHGYKSMPAPITGQDRFQGKIVHSHNIKSGENLRGQRVLVVGLGNSGADLAAELGPISRQVYVSIRHGTWVAHRVGPFGWPLDLFYLTRIADLLRRVLPYRFFCACFEFFLNIRFDHTRYRLKPQTRILSQHITVNDALPNLIISGRVQLRPTVVEFHETGVIFDDGTKVEVDTVIFATGYRIHFPFISEDIVKVDKNRLPLYKYVFPPHLKQAHTLGFIGLVQPLGPIMPMAELQARWAARLLVDDKCKLPDETTMIRDIEKKRKEMQRFYESERHTVSFDWIPYMDEIALQIGAMPCLWRYFFTDPRLWFKLFFSCACSYQYRLSGPFAWPKARETIMKLNERVETPFRTRKADDNMINGLYQIRYCSIAIGSILLTIIVIVLSLL